MHTPRSSTARFLILSAAIYLGAANGVLAWPGAVTYPQPYISSFTPTLGPVGTVITVSGTGFTGVNAAWIGATHDASVSVVSDTEATITVPKDATSGQVAVLNPENASFSPSGFTVTKQIVDPQPYISAFTPAMGPVGTVITVSGSGFTGLTAAWIGATHDVGVTAVSDTEAKLTVPKDATSGQVAVFNPEHASFSPSNFTVTPVIVNPTLSLRVVGTHFIDGAGAIIQLRGVNVSGLEFTAVQGWDPADPWGGMSPNFAAIKSWGANSTRFPLNEASWLGYTCVDVTGASRDPDPGHNYQATVKKAVADATAAGLYILIDLHWTAPKNFCPLAQNPMADADNSIAFWTSIAATFKNSPNVLFSLFNEPFFYYLTPGEVDWNVLMNGGTETQYVTGGTPYTVNYTWQTAGMQQIINAVRATGATNPVVVAGVSFAQDLSQWVAYAPTDPLKQMAAVWHAYPESIVVGDPLASVPKFGVIAYTWTKSVVDAGYPVLTTEYGDHDVPGTVGAPFASILLPWADALGISYHGWTWDPWLDPDNVLIKDATGTPTDGFGVYVKAHYLCVATGTADCP